MAERYGGAPEREPDTDTSVKARNARIAELSAARGAVWRRAFIDGAARIFSVASEEGVDAALGEGRRRFGEGFCRAVEERRG